MGLKGRNNLGQLSIRLPIPFCRAGGRLWLLLKRFQDYDLQHVVQEDCGHSVDGY